MIRRIGLYALALLVLAGGAFMRGTIRTGVRTAIDYVTGADEAQAAPAPAATAKPAAKGPAAKAALETPVSAPPMSGPKRAAQNAADKVNARTAAQANAAADAPASNGATTRTGVATPAGKATSAPATTGTSAATTSAATNTAAAPARTSSARPSAPTTVAVATPAPQPAAATANTAGAPEREVAFEREVFAYDAAGRRDPFLSLLSSGDLRPVFSDLLLVGVIYDPTGRRPVAVMRDVTTNDQYRVTTGQVLGRMRVAQIEPKAVLFTIEEFGFSRQERLALGDSSRLTRARGQ